MNKRIKQNLYFNKLPQDKYIFVYMIQELIYIYIYLTHCRQYCFGLLGLISAVLMSRMEVKLKKPPQMSHTCGTSKPCHIYVSISIFFCLFLLFTSSSPCCKDQFAVSYFSTRLIVLIQVYNWEVRHHS